MTRRLRTIAIFLLLGAVANVGVAWGYAAFSDLRAIPFPGRFHARNWWDTHLPFASDAPMRRPRSYGGHGVTHIVFGGGVVRVTAGWPMESVEGVRWQTAATSASAAASARRASTRSGSPASAPSAAPTCRRGRFRREAGWW